MFWACTPNPRPGFFLRYGFYGIHNILLPDLRVPCAHGTSYRRAENPIPGRLGGRTEQGSWLMVMPGLQTESTRSTRDFSSSDFTCMISHSSPFLFCFFYSPIMDPPSDDDDARSIESEGKEPPPRCTACKKFLKRADPHPLCIFCRPCAENSTCELDVDWTPDQWQEVEAKRTEKREKSRKSTLPPEWTKILATMESVASRLSALETQMKVSWFLYCHRI